MTRRRRGRGFEYLDERGHAVRDEETLARIRALAIPPAWRDVWICPDPLGHLQATGVDAAGRKQYRYHDRWRERRDQAKFDDMIRFAEALPGLRERVDQDLAGRDEPTREVVLAALIRLLDRGFFRIGSEEYAERNGTYGVVTLQREHVRLEGDLLRFDYLAKGGQRRRVDLFDPDVAAVVRRLKRRRAESPALFAYRRTRRWTVVRSEEVGERIKELTGGDFSAKDFRTWNATVLAAVALAVSAAAAGSRTARKRAISRAVTEVSLYLGNTPAVCRRSYIDPRVFHRFEAGVTIGGALGEIAAVQGSGEPAVQGEVEEAVLDLLSGDVGAPAIERVAVRR
jgi:DNA topoisomerase IB